MYGCSKFLPGRSSDPLVLQGFWWKTYRKEEGTSQGPSGHLRFFGWFFGDDPITFLKASSFWGRRFSQRLRDGAAAAAAGDFETLLKVRTALCTEPKVFAKKNGVLKSCIQWFYVLLFVERKTVVEDLSATFSKAAEAAGAAPAAEGAAPAPAAGAWDGSSAAVCISFHFMVDRFLNQKLVDPTNSFLPFELWMSWLDYSGKRVAQFWDKKKWHHQITEPYPHSKQTLTAENGSWVDMYRRYGDCFMQRAKRRKGQGQSVWKPSELSLTRSWMKDVALTFSFAWCRDMVDDYTWLVITGFYQY